ncbi:hypothetical protein BH11PSE2_BH11PSE2_07030 [soil metagenome]
MSYICYVYERSDQVPYMEVLNAQSLADAEVRALALLGDRPHATKTEIWSNDLMIRAFDRAQVS